MLPLQPPSDNDSTLPPREGESPFKQGYVRISPPTPATPLSSSAAPATVPVYFLDHLHILTDVKERAAVLSMFSDLHTHNPSVPRPTLLLEEKEIARTILMLQNCLSKLRHLDVPPDSPHD